MRVCPFCGYEPSGTRWWEPTNQGQHGCWTFALVCDMCEAIGPHRMYWHPAQGKDLAIEAWNKRDSVFTVKHA